MGLIGKSLLVLDCSNQWIEICKKFEWLVCGDTGQRVVKAFNKIYEEENHENNRDNS